MNTYEKYEKETKNEMIEYDNDSMTTNTRLYIDWLESNCIVEAPIRTKDFVVASTLTREKNEYVSKDIMTDIRPIEAHNKEEAIGKYIKIMNKDYSEYSIPANTIVVYEI